MSQIILKPFYLMRHATTIDNERSVISGSGSDTSISANGVKEAEVTREIYYLLYPNQPERIIVTSLKRTTQTGHIITGGLNNFITDKRLDERDLGEYDGMLLEAYQSAGLSSPGEESKASHSARTVAAMNHHLKVESKNPPLIITHSGTIRRIFHAAGFSEPAKVANTQILHFVPAGRDWQVFKLSAAGQTLIRSEVTPSKLNLAQKAAPNWHDLGNDSSRWQQAQERARELDGSGFYTR